MMMMYTRIQIEAVKAKSMEAGAFAAVLSDHWSKGGEGAVDLANAVVAATQVSR